MTKYVFISLLLICVHWGGTFAGNFREKIFNTQLNQFMCLNGDNISREKYCDENTDCTDSSDEEYCGRYSRNCPTTYPFFRCQRHNYHKCIPHIWVCDGINDCPYEDDEKNCGNLGLKLLTSGTVSLARQKAVRWIYEQAKNRTSTDKWRAHVQKTSVALYLSDPTFVLPNGARREMSYEVSIRLLSKLAQRKLKDVPTSDLSSHINALLVTCLDPRKFHSLNLVKELRSRVNSQNFSIPYDILTLCNAGETITKKDVDKLIKAFWTHQMELWTEHQAVAVMALVCAGHQLAPSFPLKNITKFTEELKKKQYRNGTVENLHTTALVMQALFAAEPEDDDDNFDEEKALHHIIQEQREDGSFGSVLNNYYVLPVLSYRSMVDISSDHCDPYIKDEDTGLQDLMNRVGRRMRIRYSLWIGDEKDLERILKLRVLVNTSFYGVMEIAGDLDPQFRFQYTVKNGRPYVYSISGIQDDVESGKFWFPYIYNGTEFIPVRVSPAELIPKDNDYIAMWYRRGSWIK